MSATVNSENHYLCSSLLDFIMDKAKKIRYVFSVFMVILMVGLAEWAGEKEIIFPEMAALTIGMWVIDKRVWKVRRWQMIWMMTAGGLQEFVSCVILLCRCSAIYVWLLPLLPVA